MLAALPPELRSGASRLVERFHLDAAGWFTADEPVPHLPVLAEAVWQGRVVDIGHAPAGQVVQRRLRPFGVVLKAGAWYLVAEVGVPRLSVTLRIDPRHIGLLADLAGVQAVRDAERLTPPGAADPDGWQHLRLQLEWPHEVPGRLLALADHAEVLEPTEVREQLLALARRVARAYARDNSLESVGSDGAGEGALPPRVPAPTG
ncbi:hypothetical protein BH24CHL6_BH24CHL6_10920 [soil metagenome]